MNPALFKSLLLAAAGIVVQLALSLLKKGKSKKLESMEKAEEEERKRLMEEEWERENKEFAPEMVLFKELDPSEFEKVKVYDGELNPMTFNHVKATKAFDTSKIEIDEDMSWLDTTNMSTTVDTTNIDKTSSPYKRSEDGWNRNYKRQSRPTSEL